MVFLLSPRIRPLLLLGPSAKEVADPHAEPVGNQIGDAENKENTRGETGSRYARYYRQCRNRAVDGSENEVSKVTVSWSGLKSGPDGLASMARF
jgi:hypothetical protein